MKRLIISLIALSVAVGCGQQEVESPKVVDSKGGVSGIDLIAMDASVRPGDDFFGYTNGGWVKRTKMPADKARFGVFDALRDESQEAVKSIIEKSARLDSPTGTDEQKVGDLYKSFLDWETRNARGLQPLQPQFDRIDAIAGLDDLAAYFASALKRGFELPIGAQQIEDFLDPSRYTILLSQSGLGLPDREYYFKDDEKSAAIRRGYIGHIEHMFNIAGLKQGAAAAETIMALETRLAAVHMHKEKMRDYAGNYRKFNVSELAEVMPNFNWSAYLNGLGIQDLTEIVIYNLEYLQALDDIILGTRLDTWKTYLTWSALNQTASRLTSDLDAQNFEFFGKVLSGAKKQRPDWRRAVRTVDRTLGEIVGKVYVKEYFPPQAKARMLDLVGHLVNAYEKSITRLDWMGEATKAEALDKLSKFTAMIGYPDKWRDYSALVIKSDDFYGNLERAALAEYERLLKRQRGPVDRQEWAMNPQTVNAYYNPPLNQIVFPAAILQPPFFNMEADDAVNYGAIGAVIGHEIGHGFDDKGSTFDGAGVLRNWWTDQDRAEFEKRTGRLIAQYNAFKPFDDLSVNGEFTQGENIGDLGGITIGLLAYQMSRGPETPPIIDNFTGTQRVFLGFAQVWRGIIRDEALRTQIATDPHSPGLYRANGPVRNVDAWYEAFQVEQTDALYLPPEERVKIW